jgi:hypothetical protein
MTVEQQIRKALKKSKNKYTITQKILAGLIILGAFLLFIPLAIIEFVWKNLFKVLAIAGIICFIIYYFNL